MKRLLSQMETGWKSREEGGANELLKKYAERSRLMNIAYTCEGLIS